MIKERLWTRDFVALVLANGFLFAGFHFLLPTITLYAASLGATGGEIGLIGGIFGYSAICIRLFTDTGVHYLGKKKCLYLGLALSILATVSYYMFDSIHAIVAARILHGFGFGLSTTFAAARRCHTGQPPRRRNWLFWFRQYGHDGSGSGCRFIFTQ